MKSVIRREVACVAAFATLALGVAGCSLDSGAAKQKYLADGNNYFKQGKYSDATIEYRKAIQQDPLLAEAHYKLAQSFDKLGNGPDAAREYVRAADLLPDDPDAQTRAGVFLLVGGQYEDAKARALKALAKNPRHMEANILLAQSMAGMKDMDEAVKQVEKVIRMDPSESKSVAALAGLRLAQKDYKQAEAQFKRAADLDPKSMAALLGLGRFYLAAGRTADAEEWLKKAIAVSPQDPIANRSLAALYIGTNRIKEAEAPLKASVFTGLPSEQLVLVDYYFASQRTSDARALLNSLKDRPELFEDVRIRMSILEWREGNQKKAYEVVDQVLARSPRSANGNLLKGRYLVIDRQYASARDVLRIATESDRGLAAAHFWLGSAYRGLNDLDAAQKEYAEAQKLAPSEVGPQLQLAQINLQEQNFDTAETLARTAVQLAPRTGEARVMLVDVLIAAGKDAEAQKEATFLATTLPRIPEPHMQLGRILLKQGKYAEAEASFRHAMQLSDDMSAAVAGLIDTLIAAGKTPQARLLVQERLAKQPKDAESLLLAARVYSAAGEKAKAEATLKDVLAVDPSNLNAFVELSRIYVAEQRLDEARGQLEAIVAKQPRAIWAHTMIAMSLHIQNRLPEAKKRYEQILVLDPTAAIAANNLAALLTDEGKDLDRALELAQTAKQRNPDNPEFNDTLGWAFGKKGLWREAIAPLELSTSKDPENPVFRYHLGEAYAQTAQTAKARAALQQALASKTDFEGRNDAVKSLAKITGGR